MKNFWTGPQSAGIIGVSYDTLNYWTRLGLVTPTIKADKPKKRSYFSFPDIVTAAAIKSLRRQGISLQMIRKAGSELLRIGMNLELGLRGGVIVADNKQLLAVLYTFDDAIQIMSLLRGGQLLLPLDRIVDDIQGKIEEMFGLKIQIVSPVISSSAEVKIEQADSQRAL